MFLNLHAEESADSIATSDRKSLFHLKTVVKSETDIKGTFNDIRRLVNIIKQQEFIAKSSLI